MAGYLSMKMKRKDLEEVNDEFSDFSLSSPARKIRRLDAELPPIMEEEGPEVPLVLEQSVMPEEQLPSNLKQGGVSGPIIEELPTVTGNEERAVVLFKPVNTPLLHSPSNFSVLVNPDIISGFKNQILWSCQSNTGKLAEDEATPLGSNNIGTNECLAVVPWVPSQIFPKPGSEVPQTEVSEMMDAEDAGTVTMDIEENNVIAELGQECEFGRVRGSEDLHQWQQQHCMIPQLPQNTSTPIVWFR